ncbi:sigma 54-interacting transcriptional regulator [Mucilaginibacter sp.]|jgi:DNA-binding NtrC family response regulator|uniref:sigma 54-interacting transcriptional regulator n=1 Tax=Mucilaginibacter sp. TaxID=1882438 RepID=UPI003562291E
MLDKILIVEDQWIEANDLQIILEKSGFVVTGIAKSVAQALDLIKEDRPEMVLLDIFLKGNQTGIDLAKILGSQRIPFIYLTANSDGITLEAAKATQPYGFLVKPYRERDILVALDIASYRYENQREIINRQEKWLANMLQSIIVASENQQDKLILLAKAFEPFIPFSHIMIDFNLKHDNMTTAWLYERVGYEQYKAISGWDLLEQLSSISKGYMKYRKYNLMRPQINVIHNLADENEEETGAFFSKLRNTYDLVSCLNIPIQFKDKTALVSFFTNKINGINNDHIEFAKSIHSSLKNVIENIIDIGEMNSSLKSSGGMIGGKTPVVDGVIGKSQKLLQVLALVAQVAPVDTTVLISGETGVGKEGLANGIHQLSERKNKPFIKVNCAAIPASLIEAELFGHERGSYTGATERRIGKFEQAQGGTIFLDEVGEIPLDVQSKLLRVLQEKELERIGGRATIKVDIRIIAATNRNLYMEVAAGRFRIDLYYRLNVFPILLPPLRERRDDIPLLVDYFLQQMADAAGEKQKKLSPEVMQELVEHPWPGNIRELQNLIERQVLMTDSPIITSIDLPEDELVVKQPEKRTEKSIEADERSRIEAALKKANGKISGTGGAASLLNLTPAILSSKMKKLGIVWKYKFQ